jgi:hypothetical protein
VKSSLLLVPFGLLALLSCSLDENDPADDDGGSSGTAGTGTTSGGTSGKGGAAGGGSGGSSAGSGGASAGKGGSAGAVGGGGAGGSPSSAGSGGKGLGGGGSGGAGGGGLEAGGANAGGKAGAGAGAGGALGGAGSGGAGGGAGASGAGAGGKAGGGGAGSPGFEPCPATDPCKILPLGDSITDGVGVPGGGSYRIELFSLALENDKNITFVGGSMNGPQMVDGQPFPRAHEGHSGWTVQQIDGIVNQSALNVNPHIILLHIGTNDMYGGDPGGADERLVTLVDDITEKAPNALLVVSSIIPLPSNTSQVSTYNARVPQIVEDAAGDGKHVIYVDQFMGFPTDELADGVHPDADGYARMGAKWYAAISPYLH